MPQFANETFKKFGSSRIYYSLHLVRRSATPGINGFMTFRLTTLLSRRVSLSR